MPAPIEQLTAALSGRYTIERELGRGGMATVYLARDEKHQRPVALKVLRPELATALGPERFVREIALAAPLAHPHILPLYDSGEAAGLLYYVTPFIEGESLRDRLARERQLPIEDALQITREIGEGLGYAHSRGIVHRDIKPENILLSGGHAVLADFGIARAVEQAGAERLTESGLAIGTPAYMSPEQAAGSAAVDARSDLYSLGCVLYEMLSGEPPHSGTSAQAVVAKKLGEPAPRISVVRDTVSPGVEAALTRVLARTPADRYATAAAFTGALQAGAGAPRVLPARRWGWRTVATAGAVAAAALAAYLVRQHRAIEASHFPAAEHKPRIAVLPARAIGDTSDAWFAEGMSEEIAARLTSVTGLQVIAPQSATAQELAAAGASLRQLADTVGVQYALQQVIRSGREASGPRKLHISLQLIRLDTEANVWAESRTDTLVGGAVFDLMAQIAEQVAQALDVALSAGEQVAMRAKPTEDPAAYEAYLRGNAYATGSYGEESVANQHRDEAVAAYRQAIALDSGFAEAHARLSWQFSRAGEKDSARRHAERALALAPDLAWAHLALATCDFVDRDYQGFQAEALKAERLAPNAVEILQATARVWGRMNDYDRSQRNYERAFALDPRSWHTALSAGVAAFAHRQWTDAERYLEQAKILSRDTEPDPYLYKTWLYLSWHGSVSQGVAELQSAVARMGPRKGFVIGFMRSTYWWVSRILGRDPWYRGMLEQSPLESVTLLDSAQYYKHKAALWEGLGQPGRARAYWDSAATVSERAFWATSDTLVDEPQYFGRLGELAIVHAAQGKTRQALEEQSRATGGLTWALYRLLVTALVNAELGRKEVAAEAFDHLTRIQDGWVTPQFLALDPTLVPLKSVPRFRRLVEGR